LPTGAGKTVIFSDMIRSAIEKGTQTLVVTDRLELFKQTIKAIFHHDIPVQMVDQRTKKFYSEAPLTLGMIETIARRMKKGVFVNFNPKLIIIDEAHKAAFNRIMDAFPLAKIIGATATPRAKFLHKYYSNIVNNISVQELIDLGFLCNARSFQMQDNFDEVEVKRGKFVEKALFKHFDKPKLYSGVVEKYKEKTPGKKALVFNVSIEHAENMNKAFNDAGIHSEYITSKTPSAERDRILKAFNDGLFPVLNNVSVFTTGTDIPSIEVIIMNRATLSLILFLQCIGRGARTFPGKKEFVILDFGMNFTRHGMYQEMREWDLEPPKKKNKLGISPMKSCLKCDFMMHARIMTCPECGYVFPEKEAGLSEGVMVEVKAKVKEIPAELKGRLVSSLSVAQLVAVSKSGAISKPYVWRVVRSKGTQAVRDYSWAMGYQEGFVFAQIKEIDDNRYKDKEL